ncbi:intercellular adhesion molecule 5 isoform X2 [Antennarius striatus]|uniref:intercellular adhesion molecule 5 isoform X2 n=1 Tax=Antennarius striatus TaxID=241820 RepID=UPI0035ADAD4F
MSRSTAFVSLFLGFFLLETGVCASCPIELSSQRVVVRHGDPVSVNCSTSESEFQGIGWEATQGGTGLRRVSHLTWTVESLTDWDTSPLCYFNPAPTSGLEQCSKTVDVVVYSFPDTLSMSINDSDGIMEENREYDLTCGVKNVAPIRLLTLTWYIGGAQYETKSVQRPSGNKPEDLFRNLTFIADRSYDGITIRCEAHLFLGVEGPQLVNSVEHLITVYYGPNVECAASELLEGETLEMHCSVTGNPTPFVRWMKDGQPTDPTAPLSRTDTGLYTITAEGFSFNEREFWIEVSYGPELWCPHRYTAPEFSLNSLACTAEGNPQPEVIWYKDGKEVILPENLTRNDAGKYFITASNTLSAVNVTYEVIITYPPSQIEELEDSEVDAGSAVVLTCSSTGNPQPTYFWKYYPTDNVAEENEDGVSRLIISNATVQNMGTYMCHAWNELGNVSKTATITVNAANLECPLEMSPDRMVVEYQSTVQAAVCVSQLVDSRFVVQWEVQYGHGTNGSLWKVDTQRDWDPRPVCTATLNGVGICQKHLNFTLYKSPDSVSIQLVGSSNTVTEEREFHLRCDVTNVAPTQNLAVLWYRGNNTFHPQITDKPMINTTKLPKIVPVFRGYPEDLVCEADGHPPPTIQWLYSSDKVPRVSGNMLTISEAGIYNCSATNEVDSVYHQVEVILKEDYLPLIAGFVAVTVVAISVIFLFIYSIYYKNTRMRRYSLKNPKLSTHNGNVAHNGWDSQFPMTKLS